MASREHEWTCRIDVNANRARPGRTCRSERSRRDETKLDKSKRDGMNANRARPERTCQTWRGQASRRDSKRSRQVARRQDQSKRNGSDGPEWISREVTTREGLTSRRGMARTRPGAASQLVPASERHMRSSWSSGNTSPTVRLPTFLSSAPRKAPIMRSLAARWS